MWRNIKSTSLTDGLLDFGIPKFGQLFHTQIDDDSGHELSGLVLGYDQNVLIYRVLITLQNGLLYYCQQFHCPTSVERLGLNCKVEYIDANQGIMPESNSTWVKYPDTYLDTTFQHLVPSCPA
jgi:hypothetical protein